VLWIADNCFDEPPIQGGTEQLPTALACWKKENEPETSQTTDTPTASLKVTYRESTAPSGESGSEEEQKDPFSEEEKEELEYAPGVIEVTIPTIEHQHDDEKSAEVIATLSLESKLKTLHPKPVTFVAPEFATTSFVPPRIPFSAKGKKKADDEMSGSRSGDPRPSESKPDMMKIKAPGTFEGDCTKLNLFLAKCKLYMSYYKPKDK
jgi:hypothetical protein